MKLDGLRVIDISAFLPGPYLTLSLADHGAEVIKVEPPGGEFGRHIGASDGSSTVFFRTTNRGKKSLVLDLKDPAQRESLLKLCETADVFVESFRPGTVARLGLDYAAVSARNPAIVYCSVSAFGQTGSLSPRPAHDLAVEAEAGALDMALGSDGTPVIPAMPVTDLLASLQGLSGVLMALYRRQQTGKGDYIDISMHDATVSAMSHILGPALEGSDEPNSADQRAAGEAAFYRPYKTKDGRYVALAGEEQKFVETLLGALGRPELAELCVEGPGRRQQPVIDFLTGEFAKKTLAEWDVELAALKLCYGCVSTRLEALAHPHLEARGMVLTDAQGRRHVGPPIRFALEPAQPNWNEPAVGEHNAQILGFATLPA